MNTYLTTSDNQDLPLSSKFTRAEVMDELDRVSDTALSKKTALRKMLRFVVEATLDGKAYALKEYTIATLVFGKAETFDPRMTSLVRTQASKLREALIKHYASSPDRSGPWLWIPAGSYRAVFNHDPAIHAKTRTREAQSMTESRLGKAVRIAPPKVFPLTGNLQGIAEAVVRLQHENFGSRRLLEQLAASLRSSLTDTYADFPLEVEQTIVELGDRILLTAFITAGPSHCVLYGNSVSIPWNGDCSKAIAALSGPLSRFAMHCASLLKKQAVS